jgi:L-ascorbate metabolism protein UlaG (beta-lactamase superfamily)
LIYERLFPRWKPRAEFRPRGNGSDEGAAERGIRVRWLGTAGFVIATQTTTVLIDPFLSRPGLVRIASQTLTPDAEAIARWIPPHVDAVLCGHSHFDHLLDAPHIAAKSGAKIAGSPTTCAFAEASGVARDKLVVIPPEGASFTVGDIDVRFVPSLHGRIFLGQVPAPGEVKTPPPLPARAWHYRMGGAFGLFLKADGVSIYHNGSADLVDAELQGIHADVLIAGLAGRRGTRDYVKRLMTALTPRLVVPTHHDAFFAPLERGVHLLPGIDVDGFLREVRDLDPKVTRVTPEYGEDLVVPREDARAAFFPIN